MEKRFRQLSESEKLEVFVFATRGFAIRYQQHINIGMTDNDICNALKDYFGIAGGYAAPDSLHVSYESCGLKIWGSWHVINTCIEEPIFAGNSTVRTARSVYRINEKGDGQLWLI